MSAKAKSHPGRGCIGFEPCLNGVVGALVHIRDGGLSNVRIHMGDALDVLERLPDGSLERVYLLHPDPWPKARHAKRRFMRSEEHTSELQSLMRISYAVFCLKKKKKNTQHTRIKHKQSNN